jgi:hypothetical protein
MPSVPSVVQIALITFMRSNDGVPLNGVDMLLSAASQIAASFLLFINVK